MISFQWGHCSADLEYRLIFFAGETTACFGRFENNIPWTANAHYSHRNLNIMLKGKFIKISTNFLKNEHLDWDITSSDCMMLQHCPRDVIIFPGCFISDSNVDGIDLQEKK